MEKVEIRSELTPEKIQEFMAALSSCHELQNKDDRIFFGTVKASGTDPFTVKFF